MNMRKYCILISLLCTAAFASCGGGDDDKTPTGSVSLACQPESLSAPAEGGVYTVSVSTTGKEWGAYTDADWMKVSTQGTTSQQGTVTVTVTANPTTEVRSSSVTLMAGAERKTIPVTQAASARSA